MPQQTQEEDRKRIDLSVTQVAASALAAVAGAVLASELGVYGTVLGAAVVSIGATTGSAFFQHVFRRTGEQLRGAVAGVEQAGQPAPEPLVDPGSAWNEPQLVRARRRWTWKSYAVVSALVFGLAMVPVLAVELAAGKPMHDITTGQQGSGTSLNPGGGGKRTTDDPPPARQPSPGSTSSPTAGSTDPAGVPVSPPASGSPSPAKPSGSPSGSTGPSPSGAPSPGTATPAPTPSGDTPTGDTPAGDAAASGAAAPAAS